MTIIITGMGFAETRSSRSRWMKKAANGCALKTEQMCAIHGIIRRCLPHLKSERMNMVLTFKPDVDQRANADDINLPCEERPSDSPFVERVWHSRSDDGGSFISTAESHW